MMRRDTRLRNLGTWSIFALLIAAGVLARVWRSRGSSGDGCPPCSGDSDARRYIDRVVGIRDGVSIYLTGAGIALGRSQAGAACLVTMASDLYSRVPADQRERDDLMWAHTSLTREVVGHAWASTFGIDNGNPIDVAFVDHTGESPTMQGLLWRTPLGLWIDVLGRITPIRGHVACDPACIDGEQPVRNARG
jgi:hypothetical protein